LVGWTGSEVGHYGAAEFAAQYNKDTVFAFDANRGKEREGGGRTREEGRKREAREKERGEGEEGQPSLLLSTTRTPFLHSMLPEVWREKEKEGERGRRRRRRKKGGTRRRGRSAQLAAQYNKDTFNEGGGRRREKEEEGGGRGREKEGRGRRREKGGGRKMLTGYRTFSSPRVGRDSFWR
jgi:hypothetical protein